MPERPVATPAQPAVVEAPAPKAAAGSELAGEWVEFWALSGGADTQSYVFKPDGHFEWSAAPTSQEAVIATFGQYAFDGTHIELTIAAERPRGMACETGCKQAVEPPRVVRLATTECPPNEEARALDASYRCLSFGDRAFWLRVARD